ncbi:YwmB family TATA-box binding protein [Niallia sp. Sow4_A1]|uniref:YwmB family TATA-box binding protein n=1 Tax=Niallia sp. Sow4_A1 TaxID=3438793 RepID=UPI003F9E1E95
MKKTIIYITASVLLISLFFYFNYKVSGKEDKLLKTIVNLQSINADISQWSIYTKKEKKSNTSLNIYYQRESELKKKYQQFNWEVEKDKNHHIKLTGTLKDQNIQQLITLTAYNENDKYNILETYSYKSRDWNKEEYQNVLKSLDEKENYFFTVKALVRKKDNIKHISTLLLKKFTGNSIEKLVEDDFVSITAYNKSWKDYLTSNKKNKFNIQFGIRTNKELQDTYNLTIGSPIITEEY